MLTKFNPFLGLKVNIQFRVVLILLGLVAGSLRAPAAAVSQSLTTLEYKIVGTELVVTPSAVSVPKGIAGSVLVTLKGGAEALPAGAFVEAVLRGPSFPARRLVGAVNQPLLFPPLNLVGDYQLDGIRLVDGVDGRTILEGKPSSVPVQVFDEVLVSRVTSRPLTLDEIKEKGIVIDESNFRAVEFEVGFVLDGKTIPVRFPVVSPTFKQSTEIIPAAELEERLKAADLINQELSSRIQLPEELQGSRLNISVQPVNFQFVDVGENDLGLSIPPIPALVVIPGNIGFLNQFFSVQIFAENAAPSASGLSVVNVQAKLILPPGPDRVSSTNYNQPGDDPLRFARVGSGKIIQSVQPVTRPGPDGKPGTADDVARLFPGESGQGEFLVEGLQEGLHVMDLELSADLEGLAAGVVKVKGKAAGSVLVRNPKFSISFAHPRTIRSGEPYEASVTILNTSQSVANLVRVTLPASSLSGAVLESEATVEIGQILPGQSATARYKLRAQRTGSISFSNLTTGDEASAGRFTLTMGVDERGVALSPDTIAMPDFVNDLPFSIRVAAERVLGQALSIATAPLLPPGVKPVNKNIVTRRTLELAEAGQRVRYGDSLKRVLADLLLDWQGGRNFNDGYDQIIRETDAGREWREALVKEMELADSLDAVARLGERGPDFAGLSQSWLMSAVNVSGVEISATSEGATGDPNSSAIPGIAGYAGTRGAWMIGGSTASNAVFRWKFTNAIDQATLRVLIVSTNGEARQFTTLISNQPAGACVSFVAGGNTFNLDQTCDGIVETPVNVSPVFIRENPPQLITVLQDGALLAGRPPVPCVPTVPAFPMNYGTIVAVLFSKPMPATSANVASAYRLENGNSAGSVQIQPGGRVALLNLRQGISQIIPRTMTVTGVTDARGNLIISNSIAVQATLREGVAIRGQVVRGDGNPAAGVPVTLTMYDRVASGDSCSEWVVRASQVLADTNGFFAFDFVMAGVHYSISATDTSGLSLDLIQLLLESSNADETSRGKLLELASSAAVRNTLFEAFGTTVLPQAIAKVEGLDRALLRDVVGVGSGRVGSTVPVALRFRGRGTVTGTVVASDGVTSRPDAAVNLFPDPASRELGRGVFSDSNGRFAFFGVPLGVFSIEAATGDGLSRVISEALNISGETRDLLIVLSAAPVLRASISGRVTENDNTTPHPGAQVYIGQASGLDFCCIVGQATSDSDGFWQVTNVVASTYDIVAISQDGKRRGDRRDILLSAGPPSFVNISLQGRATVIGRVETSTGQPVAGALVAGGEGIVRTDANGTFILPGVPTGRRTINTGVERTIELGDPKSNPAFDFPRFGSLTLDVLPAGNNLAVIRLAASGRIDGRVLDAAGNPVPNAQIMHPVEGGFEFMQADARGNFRWENLPINKSTTLSSSAAGAPTAKTDVSGILKTLGDGGSSADEIKAAIGEAASIFTGASNPLLNGEGAAFNPLTFGFIKETLRFDRQVIVADIRFRPSGRIAGQVLNGQGVPIGAKVRLTSEGLLPDGQPGTVLRGDVNSDPALGTFSFDNLPVGFWGLQAASPFFPLVIAANGQTTSTERSITNVVLQFPAAREINGRLGGVVFQPDGITPVDEGVKVKISFGDLEITTETNGTFDTRFALPAGGYRVEAFDPISGLKGLAQATVRPTGSNAVENLVDIRLLGKGALRVRVLQASTAPATGARVEIQLGSFPGGTFEGTADTNGFVLFENLFEGSYSVAASFASGPTALFGRSGAAVGVGTTSQAVVGLGATAILRGKFVKRDLITPITFAQVAIGNVGFATTDTNGVFEISGLPLGSYRITSSDPISGRGALQNLSLAVANEVREIVLVEQSLGEVRGAVIDGYGTGFVPGARVTLNTFDGLSAERSVTTGPDGRFSFPNMPAGPFTISAVDSAKKFRGQVNRTLAENVLELEVNVPLTPLAVVPLVVVLSDGVTPATNAFVEILPFSGDTGTNGRVTFVDVPLGGYTLRAGSRNPIDNHNLFETNFTVSAVGTNSDFVVRLPGVGRVEGTVFGSDGVTRLPAVTVSIQFQSVLFQGQQEFTLTDSLGAFRFVNVPMGPYRVLAEEQALAASANGILNTNSQRDVVSLQLSSSGIVTGRLTRKNGLDSVAGAEVLLTFQSASSLPGRAVERTDSTGRFRFDGIPLRNFQVEAVVAAVNGIARTSGAISTNGQVVDLGILRLDESDLTVVNVIPGRTATSVPTTAPVQLFFSEAIATNSLDTNGIFLRLAGATANVPAALQLVADSNGVGRVVSIEPFAPLQSLKTYEVVVIDGERRDPFGGVAARGPTDLVGRPLTTAFLSVFSTKDGDPPVLLSLFPSNNAVQVDIRAIARLSFNEPVQATNFTLTLTGPNGEVAGNGEVVLNGLAIVFTPATLLQPNTTYTLRANGIRDLAGNLATNQPLSLSFTTLDTLGPVISTLRVVSGQEPVAGATVFVEALLAENEPGAGVRFTRDLTAVGSDSSVPFNISLALPDTGSTTVRAIATDRFGNDGPLAELVIAVLSNKPPTIQLRRVSPASGDLAGGGAQSLLVSAEDDVAVTNLTVLVRGAFFFSTNFPDGSQRTIVINVPSNVVVGSFLEIVAGAIDGRGLRSSEASLLIKIADLASPTVEIISPAAGSVASGQLNLLVATSDNSTNHQVEVLVSGAVSNSQSITVVSASDLKVTNNFVIPLNNATASGAVFQVQVTVIDGSSNRSTVVRSFVLPDKAAPSLLSINPAADSSGQSLWLRNMSFKFNEALASATVNSNSVRIAGSESNAPVFLVSLTNGGTEIVLAPAVPLKPGVSYTNFLGNQITDISGNVAFVSGTSFVFRTASIVAVEPTNNTEIVAGQPVRSEIRFDQGLGARIVRFQLNSNAPVQISLSDDATNAFATLLTTTNDTAARIHISLSDNAAFTHPLILPEIVLNLRAPTSDSDGDGMSDSFELANGLDPLRNDAGEDPDGDGLTNLAESRAGTNPRNADTDGDGIRDGVDPNPTVSNSRPLAQTSVVTNANGTLTIVLGGSDLDGDALSAHLTSLPEVGRIFLTSDGANLGTAIINLPAIVTGSPPRLIYRPIGVASTNELRYLVNDGFTNSSEALITLISTNNPNSDVDGDGLKDVYEHANGLDPFLNDAALDLDGDGLTNQQEFNLGTKPNRRDTDNDGLSDGAEVTLGTNPFDPDTDDDGIFDGADPNPFTPNGDFDGDGIADVDDLDIDGDGLANTDELALGTEARNPDTDGDGWRDGVEVEVGTDPLQAASVPVLFVVAQPEVGLVLPLSLQLDPSTFGLTVGQPEVGLVLPASVELDETTFGLTVAHPEVGLVLPSSLGISESNFGLTVAQPEVGLVLPSSLELDVNTFGLTVAQPEVGLILPANPDLRLETFGLTVAQPEVFLRLDESSSGSSASSNNGTGQAAGTNGRSQGLVLSLVHLPTGNAGESLRAEAMEAVQAVVLEWNGPGTGSYVVEFSIDFENWAPAVVQQISSISGTFRVRCDVNGSGATYFRLRHLP